MSKEENLALAFLKKLVSHTTLYKGTIDELEVYEPADVIWAYKEGYHQAQKDLELTWEDMECIIKHYQGIMAEKSRVFVRVEDYEELLKRYKNYKEMKEK